MYKKLQHKFLWGSVLVLMLVIVLVIGITFGVTNYTVTRQTQVFIDLILDNNGEMPERGNFAPQQETFLALNTESINEARFVSVLFSGETSKVVSIQLNALSESAAADMAAAVLDRTNDNGSLGDGRRKLQYGRRIMEDGSTLVVIADSTSRYGLSRLIILYMAGLWLVVLILFVIAMGRYSKKLVKPFVENDEKQKRFITNASHELKTPLAVIAANNEMTEAVGGKTKWTESTSRQVKRLQTLIESLVVLTRMDEMKEIELKEVDYSAVVLETAEPFRSVIEGSGKTYDCRISEGIHVMGDKRTLQQIASVLLDNAAKYCDEGGNVSVRLVRKGKTALLSVSNTYAAGKSEDTSRFFERFYRQDESHHSGKSGFGIGLSMAREMAEQLKGKLNAGYDKGTITFTVEL